MDDTGKYADPALLELGRGAHIGANGPLTAALTTDGVALAGGLNTSAPDDFLRNAVIYSPSWHAQTLDAT